MRGDEHSIYFLYHHDWEFLTFNILKVQKVPSQTYESIHSYQYEC